MELELIEVQPVASVSENVISVEPTSYKTKAPLRGLQSFTQKGRALNILHTIGP